MGIKRALGDFRELRQSVVELFDDGQAEEAEASLRITKSARQFTKNTKEVVDDKLSFSATLMRAGEVQAANRLLAEVEHTVREEEAALFESVNEVKAAQSLRRERITRLRLARMLAVAALGSAVLSFSAAGMAVAGFLRDRAEVISRPNNEGRVSVASATNSGNKRIAPAAMRRLRIGDVDVLLTKSQFERLRELGGTGSSSIDELEELLNVLPEPLAEQLQEAITLAEGEAASVETDVSTAVAHAEKEAARKKRAARKAAAEAQQQDEEPAEDPTPQPTPSEDDKNNSSDEEDEDGDSGGSEEEGGDQGPPVPIKP